ncbi:hypothetical protein ACFV90_36890 [Streptomyces sp. NPDC059904]|uniref:hypothetical protein n=1 Tax=Streptomyces sp. NPDC059904 TaxID=3346996 RepID=UPI00364B046D
MTDLHEAARRALAAMDDLIHNTTDPGVETLGARHELATVLINTPSAPTDRAAVLREAADDWTAHCPDHSNAEEAFMDCPCDWADELRRKADEVQQVCVHPEHYDGECPCPPSCACCKVTAADAEQPADAFAAADCPYGEGPGDGSGCIKPAGHDGDHVVTAGVSVKEA